MNMKTKGDLFFDAMTEANCLREPVGEANGGLCVRTAGWVGKARNGPRAGPAGGLEVRT